MESACCECNPLSIIQTRLIDGAYLSLAIAGLAEKRPSVLLGKKYAVYM